MRKLTIRHVIITVLVVLVVLAAAHPAFDMGMDAYQEFNEVVERG